MQHRTSKLSGSIHHTGEESESSLGTIQRQWNVYLINQRMLRQGDSDGRYNVSECDFVVLDDLEELLQIKPGQAHNLRTMQEPHTQDNRVGVDVEKWQDSDKHLLFADEAG